MRITQVLAKNITFPPIPTKIEFSQYSRALATLKKNRAFLTSTHTADEISKEFGPNLWDGKTVVELFPGPGVLTRSMIKNGASGIIPLEPAKIFLPMLKSLEDCCDVPFYLEHGDHRMDDTFHSLLEDVSQKFQTKVERPKVDWNEVHPSMVFSSLSSSINESYHLSMLLVYSIFRRDGWFKYGRLPVVMLAPPEVLKGIKNASLVGFLWRAVADVETSIELPSDAFVTRRSMQAIKLIPTVVPKIQAPLETYHFILSKLMVRKAQSLSSSLSAIAPGAATIRSKLTFDVYKNCSRLTLSEVDQVTLKYIEWYKNRHGAAPIHAFV